MSLTPERIVKNKATAILKAYKAYYFYPFSAGYGKVGVPDIICCYHGRFIGIECKAGKNSTTLLQRRNLDEIQTNGGIALVVNEDNVEAVQNALENIRAF
jgi:hypothetical protein